MWYSSSPCVAHHTSKGVICLNLKTVIRLLVEQGNCVIPAEMYNDQNNGLKAFMEEYSIIISKTLKPLYPFEKTVLILEVNDGSLLYKGMEDDYLKTHPEFLSDVQEVKIRGIKYNREQLEQLSLAVLKKLAQEKYKGKYTGTKDKNTLIDFLLEEGEKEK